MIRRQRIVLIALTLAVGVTRLAALSRTLWDWDEMLFCTALHDYDVAQHHPHPPGFPLYVVLGRLLRMVMGDDFRALQAINLIAAVLIFPAVYLLGRAFRFEFSASVTAALLFAFLPNVWFFGGTAFSDVPALAALVFALAMLLRGREDRRAFLIGCALLGVALAFRPQNLLVGAYPFAAAAWARLRERWRDALLGAAAVTAIVVISYGGAAYVTGFDAYRVSLRRHSDYLMRVDSYRSPARAPVRTLVPRFLLQPVGRTRVVIGMTILAAIALLRARRRSFEVLATFAPFFIAACLLLNVESSSRYSMTWLVGTALLAAEGIHLVAGALRRLGAAATTHLDRPGVAISLEFLIALIIVAREVRFSNEALQEVRRHPAPTFAAMQWIRAHVDGSSKIYVVRNVQAFADAFLGDYTQVAVAEDGSFDVKDARGAWLVTENAWPSPDAINFTRPRNELFDIARQRYFEVAVVPLSDVARFGDGWFDDESNGVILRRWMGRTSTALLPPITGNGELWLRVCPPLNDRWHPVVTVSFNGRVVDRFACTTASVERRLVLPSRLGTPNELRLETDRVFNPVREHLSDDDRDLGLQLRGIAWKAAS